MNGASPDASVNPSTSTQEVELQLATGPAPATALLRFTDPVAGYAMAGAPVAGTLSYTLMVAVYPWGQAADTFATWTARVCGQQQEQPLFVKGRGIELWWCPSHAVLQCDVEEAEPLLAAVAEFAWYEEALRTLEAEIASGWPALEVDKSLAFDVTAKDLRGSDALGLRMAAAFQRRIHFSRLEPHLFAADTRLAASAQKLGSDLREKAHFEERAEAMDAHLEIFEHIYEMASQRMGEFRASHGSDRAEWIIIWLLVAEVTLSLLQVLFKR